MCVCVVFGYALAQKICLDSRIYFTLFEFIYASKHIYIYMHCIICVHINLRQFITIHQRFAHERFKQFLYIETLKFMQNCA